LQQRIAVPGAEQPRIGEALNGAHPAGCVAVRDAQEGDASVWGGPIGLNKVGPRSVGAMNVQGERVD